MLAKTPSSASRRPDGLRAHRADDVAEPDFGQKRQDDPLLVAAHDGVGVAGELVDVLRERRDLERDRARVGLVEK